MRDAVGAVGICIISALVGCMSSPYLDQGSPPRNESEYLRVREELRDYRERIAAQTTAVDDGSLDHLDNTTDQSIDPMMDDDMMFVIVARNVVEERNVHGTLSQTEWVAELRTEIRIATNATSAIQPAERTAFRHPETVREDTWCAWYVRAGKRRELTIDPSTREISQSMDWR